jgi:predicted metal-binding membrane protein
MALLFVGGVMNVVWIAGIAALVLLEKAVRSGRTFGRIAGIGLVAAGVWVLFVR